MSDGPNFEALFKGMQCLHGTNAEDVKIIVRWLRFFQGQEGYEKYANHYLPMLPKEAAAEFMPKAEKKEEPIEVESKPVTSPSKRKASSKSL